MGFAVGENGIILRTDDGGQTWKDQESPTSNSLFAVTYFNEKNAVAVGELGTVVITDNGGANWSTTPSFTGKLLQAIVYRGGTNVWAVGRGGMILKRIEPLAAGSYAPAKLPPTLRTRPRLDAKPRKPAITLTDDGDIPAALPPKKDQ